MPFNSDTASKAGQKGGATTMRRIGRKGFSERGRKGGEAVKAKYGPEYYSRIGRLSKRSDKGVIEE